VVSVVFEYDGKTLKLDKELSDLDKLVIDFVSLLDKSHIDYVIVSGYIAILLGRSRTTEDVDLFVDPTSEEQFLLFCEYLTKSGFNLLNAEDPHDAYDLMKEGSSLRVIFGNKIFPNFELKLPRSDISKVTMEEKVKAQINGHRINTSSLELQIAYKLYLGSDKDFDDARHLYRLLKDKLNNDKFKYFIKEMKIGKKTSKEALGDDIEA
jgi:predicted nucleotidyltransferase